MGAPPRKPQPDVKPKTPRRVGRAAERAAAIAEERRQAKLHSAPGAKQPVPKARKP